MTPRLLVAESTNFSAAAAEALRSCAEVRLRDLDRDGLLREARGVEILWVRLRHRIDAELLAACPRLRVVATPTTGLTHIDLDAATRRDVRIVSLRGETAFLDGIHATAEHTVGLILALLRHLPAALDHVTHGGWDRDLFRGTEIAGRTIGLVGFGRLGRMVAGLLLAFGARVLACDPARTTEEMPAGVALVDLPVLLAESDIVSLHASVTAGAPPILGERELAGMKRGALFINTARGELVDETALIAALDRGAIGGAALDVVGHERAEAMDEHPVVSYARRHPHVLVTPHIGGCTVESMAKTELFLARKLRALLTSGAGAPDGRAATSPGNATEAAAAHARLLSL